MQNHTKDGHCYKKENSLIDSNFDMLKVAPNTVTIIIVVYYVHYYVIKFVRSVVFSRYINTNERHDMTDDGV